MRPERRGDDTLVRPLRDAHGDRARPRVIGSWAQAVITAALAPVDALGPAEADVITGATAVLTDIPPVLDVFTGEADGVTAATATLTVLAAFPGAAAATSGATAALTVLAPFTSEADGVTAAPATLTVLAAFPGAAAATSGATAALTVLVAFPGAATATSGATAALTVLVAFPGAATVTSGATGQLVAFGGGGGPANQIYLPSEIGAITPNGFQMCINKRGIIFGKNGIMLNDYISLEEARELALWLLNFTT